MDYQGDTMSMRTDPNYWDCDCRYDYIHPKSEEWCVICGTSSHNMPDSHSTEVLLMKIRDALNDHPYIHTECDCNTCNIKSWIDRMIGEE
jgi:hypothetical protein